MMSREYRMKEKLDIIKEKYDYIIIDCPPSLGLVTLNSFTASDSVLIPVQCEYYALEGLGQLLNTIKLVQKHLNKELVIEGALLTMYDIRTNLLESYDRLIAFADKHLDDKFYLEGTQRIDVRNKITRELCANLLIHREFFNPYPAKLIIEKNCIRTENANRAKMIGKLDIHF